jgi:hypothetical protein
MLPTLMNKLEEAVRAGKDLVVRYVHTDESQRAHPQGRQNKTQNHTTGVSHPGWAIRRIAAVAAAEKEGAFDPASETLIALLHDLQQAHELALRVQG